MPALTKTQRDALIATVSLAVGASGGAYVDNLQDPGLLTADEVVEMQEQHFAKYGEYEQILPKGSKPNDAREKGNIPNFGSNMEVHVYDGPEGKGYTIIEETDSAVVSISHGPEAAGRSSVKVKTNIASTTP